MLILAQQCLQEICNYTEWIMTTYPEIVAEYIQYDDNNPFEPIQLSCAVQDLNTVQAEHGKLTVIVHYWTQ